MLHAVGSSQPDKHVGPWLLSKQSLRAHSLVQVGPIPRHAKFRRCKRRPGKQSLLGVCPVFPASSQFDTTTPQQNTQNKDNVQINQQHKRNETKRNRPRHETNSPSPSSRLRRPWRESAHARRGALRATAGPGRRAAAARGVPRVAQVDRAARAERLGGGDWSDPS